MSSTTLVVAGPRRARIEIAVPRPRHGLRLGDREPGIVAQKPEPANDRFGAAAGPPSRPPANEQPSALVVELG